MKKILPFLALVCAFSLAPSIRVSAGEAGQKQAGEQITELGKAMKKMGKPFRVLAKQVADASKNEESLQLVADMRAAAEECLTFKPAMTADLPADKQAQFIADYQAGMKTLIADLDKLSEALKAGDNAQAATVLRSLKGDQKRGHDAFRTED